MTFAYHLQTLVAAPYNQAAHTPDKFGTVEIPRADLPSAPWRKHDTLNTIITDTRPPRHKMQIKNCDLRLNLIAAGISIASIDAYIASIPDQVASEAAAAEWKHREYFHRLHPLVVALVTELGKTDEEADALFTTNL